MSHILIVSYSLSILVSALWFVKILIRRIKSKSWLDDLVRLTNNQPINVVTTGSTARNQSVLTSNNQHQRDLILMQKFILERFLEFRTRKDINEFIKNIQILSCF